MTDALTYFSNKLLHETDAADVFAALNRGERLMLVDVRSPDAWDQGHAVGAVHLPYQQIAARAADVVSPDAVEVVVYCWSPGCNAGARAAVEFTKLGYRVREMIGGFEYWAREGYPVASADGPVPRTRDPLVALVRA